MTRALLTTWGRNILPSPNRSPTTFMPSMSGPSMTSSGRSACWRASSVSSIDEVVDALDQRVLQALARPAARASSGPPGAPCCCRRPVAIGDVQQRSVASSRRLRTTSSTASRAAPPAVVVDGQLARVDDAHVHAGANGVVQEHGVDRLAHRVVAAEREGHVGHAAGDLRVGQGLLDPARGLDEVHRVVVVLLDAGGDGEDVRVEDDVLGGSRPARSAARRRGCRSRPCRSSVSAWPTSSKAMTTTAAP
jgi:hypothetical protein